MSPRNRDVWLKYVKGAIPGKKLELSNVCSKKERRKKYEANRLARKFSVKWKETSNEEKNAMTCSI